LGDAWHAAAGFDGDVGEAMVNVTVFVDADGELLPCVRKIDQARRPGGTGAAGQTGLKQ
jgi:hypothetical protein